MYMCKTLCVCVCVCVCVCMCVCVCVCVCSEVEEDMVFEEFKRSNMKGMKADNDEEDGNVSGGDDMAPKEK